MADYNLSYSGQQVNNAIGKALNPDTAPIEDSNNLITSGGVKAYVDEHTADYPNQPITLAEYNALTTEQKNADIVYQIIDDYSNPDVYTKSQIDTMMANVQPSITIDSTPTAESTNPVSSGGVKTYVDTGLSGKQNTLTFDNVPASGSSNPVKSSGVKTYVDSHYVTAGKKSGTTLGSKATAEGDNTTASGQYSHAEGDNTIASGQYSHAEGTNTWANTTGAHAEGSNTVSEGYATHAEGAHVVAGDPSFTSRGAHAEGFGDINESLWWSGGKVTGAANATTYTYSGFYALPSATDRNKYIARRVLYLKLANQLFLITNMTGSEITVSSTLSSSALSNQVVDLLLCTSATGDEGSHAEGCTTSATGCSAHSEGNYTWAGGNYSHAQGYETEASRRSQHIFGEYNITDTGGTGIDSRGSYVEIVGNGTANNARSNARTLDWSGNEVLAGKLTVGVAPTETMDVATKQYVDGITKPVYTNWSPKTWNGLTDFYGAFTWTDGENIYFSNWNQQYVLNKSTSTWSEKIWNGEYVPFEGREIWTDGDNIYYSEGSSRQYVLNKSTSTWSPKTWNGFTDFEGMNIWTDGDNIYCSEGSSKQYVLNKSTSTWSPKIWNGFTDFGGRNIWTDGDNIYYDAYYVLDKSTSTWSSKTWNGLTEFYGSGVWTDGYNIYYSYYNYISTESYQYVLDKSTSTWLPKTWSGLTSIHGRDGIWTDGENIYCSDPEVGAQCVLDKQPSIVKVFEYTVPTAEYVDTKAEKSLTFQVTLTTSGWSNNAQTITNSNFIVDGYTYTVAPASTNFSNYINAQIYADDVTTANQITFHCNTVPTSNITVNVLRIPVS